MYGSLMLPKGFRLDQFTGEVYIFWGIWLATSFVSFIWAYDKAAAFDSSIKIIQYALIFIITSQALINRNHHPIIAIFAQFFFVIYVAICIWEILTGNHLSNSRMVGNPLPVPTGPFYNENNTAAISLMLLPFMTVKSGLAQNKIVKAIFVISTLLFLVITIIQGARVVIVVGFLYLLLYGLFKASWFSRLVALLFILLALLIVNFKYPEINSLITGYTKLQYKSLQDEQTSYKMTSYKIRLNLIKEGLDFTWGSGLVGIGGGNFEDKIRSGRYHDTGWIENAHNFWIETLANYGIFIFTGLVYIYMQWVRRLYKKIRFKTDRNSSFYQACFVALLFFIPLSITPSTLKWMYPVWFFLGCLHAVSWSGSDKRITITEYKPVGDI